MARRPGISLMKTLLSLTLRWCIGLLLVWAALSKLADPQPFVAAIAAYQMGLPLPLIKLIAVALPWLELLCGLLLLLSHWVRAAAGLVALMFLVFFLATARAWALGYEISCGCLNWAFFQSIAEPQTLKLLESMPFATFRNLLLLLGSGFVWITASAVPTTTAHLPTDNASAPPPA
jgi:putative oxidoreductase